MRTPPLSSLLSSLPLLAALAGIPATTRAYDCAQCDTDYQQCTTRCGQQAAECSNQANQYYWDCVYRWGCYDSLYPEGCYNACYADSQTQSQICAASHGNCDQRCYALRDTCRQTYCPRPASCTLPGACTPGSTRACGRCGTQTCQADCTWPAACGGEGVCTPGQSAACGRCGTRYCQSSCTWGACGGEYGQCTPGEYGGACASYFSLNWKCSNTCSWECVNN